MAFMKLILHPVLLLIKYIMPSLPDNVKIIPKEDLFYKKNLAILSGRLPIPTIKLSKRMWQDLALLKILYRLSFCLTLKCICLI